MLFLVALSGCQHEKIETKFSVVPEVIMSSLGESFFTRVGNSYDNIVLLPEINEKIVAIATNNISDSSHEMFVVYGDKEFGPYSYVGNVIDFQDGIAFYARENTSDIMMIKNGVDVHMGEDRADYIVTDRYSTDISKMILPYEVSSLYEVNGKLAFDVLNYTKWSHCADTDYWCTQSEYSYFDLFYDFEEIGGQYDSASNLFELDGKLHYQAAEGKKNFIIADDGKLIGDQYDSVENFVKLEEKLYYLATKDEKKVIVADGKPIDTPFEEVYGLSLTNGVFSYCGTKDGKTSIVINDATIPVQDSSCGNLKTLDGKIVFVAEKDVSENYIYYGDKKIGPYKAVEAVKLGDHVIFKMINFDEESAKFVFVDGKTFGPFGYIPDGGVMEDLGEIYFTAKRTLTSPYQLHRVSDDKIVAENSDEDPEIKNGRIVYTKYVYEGDSPFPSGFEFYVDGENLSKKYKGRFSSFSAFNFKGDFAVFASKAMDGSPDNDGQFYIIMNESEYGPFPESDFYFYENGKLFLKTTNVSGKKELYVER